MQKTLPCNGVNLRDIFSQCRITPPCDFRVTSCCSDWQQCRQGDIYVALLEAERDGHDFVGEASARG